MVKRKQAEDFDPTDEAPEEKEALSCCKMGTGGATGSTAGKVAAINGNTDNKNCFIISGKLQHVGYISSGRQHFFEKKWRENCLQ